jgi:hypothetical protein
MQKMKSLRMSEPATEECREATLLERRHFTHKRMDRWIRLQQFVFGLPDDYSYAICTTAQPDGSFRSRSMVKVGWMTWYGDGRGNDRQHALAVALLGSAEALSSNSTLVFWHSVAKRMRSAFRRLRRKELPAKAAPGHRDANDVELLAG